MSVLHIIGIVITLASIVVLSILPFELLFAGVLISCLIMLAGYIANKKKRA